MARRAGWSSAPHVGSAAPSSAPILLPLALALITLLGLACPGGAEARARPPRASGVWHVVKQGQTLFRISEAYGVPVAALIEANRLKPKAPLRVGQRLWIPGAKRTAAVAVSRSLTPQERETLERSLAEATLPEPPKNEVPPTRIKTDALFVWPILGPINSPYGPRWGRFHAGIDIGSPQYQEVVAAADGEVLYASETKGPLGQAVVLQHANGIRTVYAHLSIIATADGETVRQGQPIGGVGSTGRATGPHLHFEVRDNGRPVEPVAYLPATIDELVQELARDRQ